MLVSIAFRYLLAHLRQTFICIAGVTISVTMYIAMSAMMDGFKDKFIIETVESGGHITIHDEQREAVTPILERVSPGDNAVRELIGVRPREEVKRIKNPVGLIRKLRTMPGVTEAAPMVQGEAIVTYGTKDWNLVLFGIDPTAQTRVTTIGKNIIAGSFDRLDKTANGVVLGSGVASNLGVNVDDPIVLVSGTGGEAIGRVVGIFETGVTPVDLTQGYMLLSDAQTLLDRKNVINQIVVRTNNYNNAKQIAEQIEGVAGYKTESWQEANANFLKIFTIQSLITLIITGALLVVAGFGVLNILIMAVLERVNDIAILRSFGFSRGDIVRIYLMQGLVIGVIGSVIGVVIGKVTVVTLRSLPIKMEGLVKSEGLLMSESRSLYISAFVIAVLVTMAAAVYPARRAAQYDPVEIIRGAH